MDSNSEKREKNRVILWQMASGSIVYQIKSNLFINSSLFANLKKTRTYPPSIWQLEITPDAISVKGLLHFGITDVQCWNLQLIINSRHSLVEPTLSC